MSSIDSNNIQCPVPQPVPPPPPPKPVQPPNNQNNQATEQPQNVNQPNNVAMPEAVATKDGVDAATQREANLNEQQNGNLLNAELNATLKTIGQEQEKLNQEAAAQIDFFNQQAQQNLLTLNSRNCIQGCHGTGIKESPGFRLSLTPQDDSFDSLLNPRGQNGLAQLPPGASSNQIRDWLLSGAPRGTQNNIVADPQAKERSDFARRALTGTPENALFEVDKLAANKRLSSAERGQIIDTLANTWRDNGKAAEADKLLVEDASRRLNIETASQNHTPTERAVRGLDVTAALLEKGNGKAAADFLEREINQAQQAAVNLPANSPERRALEALVENGQARVQMYRAENPGSYTNASLRSSLGEKHPPFDSKSAFDTAWKLDQIAVKTEQTANELAKAGRTKEAELLKNLAADSRYQSDATMEGVRSSWSLAGQGMTETYRAIVNKSFDNKIQNADTFFGLFPDRVNKPTADKAKMNAVFDEMQRTIGREQVPMNKAWDSMNGDARILPREHPLAKAGFISREDAAKFLRDHETTKGLLNPFSDLSEAALSGNNQQIDAANAALIKTLQKNDQWDIAGQVLKEFQQNARSSEGRTAANQLAGSETTDWLKAKSADFIREELPLLVLSGVISGGAGVGVKGLTTAMKWGPKAVRAAQVATEIGVAVPTDKLLGSAINGKKADWSAGGLARDYALAVGGYGLFHALGKGWRHIRGANNADDLMRIGAGSGDNLSQATTRVRPSGTSELIDIGEVPFRNTAGWSGKFAPEGAAHLKIIQQGSEVMPEKLRGRLDELLNHQPNKPLAEKLEKIAAEQAEIYSNSNNRLFNLPDSQLSPQELVQKQKLQARYNDLQVERDGVERLINRQAEGMNKTALNLMKEFRSSLLGDEKAAREMASKLKIDQSALGKGFTEEQLREMAVDYYRLTGKGFAPDSITLKYSDPRASALPDGTLNIGDKMSKKIMMHELAHNLEFDNPELYKAAKSWVEARAKHSANGKVETGKLRDITGDDFYKNDGDAFKDHYVDPYVGRIYPHGGSTEAMTVGIQEFADAQSMLKLYRNDPEHFFLILGAIKK